jgi:hypothetical protein
VRISDLSENFSFSNTTDNFLGGKISLYHANWSKLTSDPFILQVVIGYELEFMSKPFQLKAPRPLCLPNKELVALDKALHSYLAMKIIEPCSPVQQDSFFSTVFVRMKKDSSARVIFNCKQLNEFIENIHFKMDTVREAILLMRPNCFFGSIDLKHAYFSVSIAKPFRKFLKFMWQNKAFQFVCLPQGICSAPRIFTKLLKPVFAHLRKNGVTILSYIDDSILVADSAEVLAESVLQTVKLLDSLGLTVHPSKSVFQPVQKIEFLGFELNSVNMTVSLTELKKLKIVALAKALLENPNTTIRGLATFIGNLVAAEPAVPHAPLYYKYLEIFRNEALKLHCGNYDASISLSSRCLADIRWWQDHIQSTFRAIVVPGPSHELTSDASISGWGGSLGAKSTGGIWSDQELTHHINWLELKAAFLSLQSLCAELCNTHIKLRMDNTTAVACVQKYGSTKLSLFDLTKELFVWALQRNLTLSATYIPGVCNKVADHASRSFNADIEWMLDKGVFQEICKIFGKPHIDLFASRLNHQLPCYISWQPDPFAFDINAFSLNWTDIYGYAFPPFSLLSRTLQKMMMEKSTLLVVVPMWPTKPWFSLALKMLVSVPRLLPKRCLKSPRKQKQSHPLEQKLTLVAMKLSGDTLLCREFLRTLPIFSQTPGEGVRSLSTGRISKNGCFFVTQGKLIQFLHI